MKKPIRDFENYYCVNEVGEVFSLPRTRSTPTSTYITHERKLKPYFNHKGYLIVDLSVKSQGKRKTKPVHRLVAEAFIPNPDNKPQINHINGIKTDNRVENLEWCDNSENQIHAFDMGLQKSNFDHPNSKLTYEAVIYIKEHYVKGDKTGLGAQGLAKKFGVSTGSVKQIIEGKSYRKIN